MKMNCLNRFLLAGLLLLPVFGARADEEQDLIAELQSKANAPQKCTACVRLRVVGTAKAVPALAALLGEGRTAHAARYALEGISAPEAVQALRKALDKTSGPIKAGLIDSLGWRHDVASVPLLVPLLSGPDTMIASAAATALSRIGDKKAVAALSAARDKAAPAVQPAVLDGLLRCADQLQAQGNAKGAATIYQGLFTAKFPDRIRVAAWRGLVVTDSGRRVTLLTGALASSQDRPVHVAALKVLRELNDAAVVEACLPKWDSLPADSQLAVLDAHLKLGAKALPTVRNATRSPSLDVRVAAWQALADLGDASAVPTLAKAAASGDPVERDAARDTLSRVRGPGVREALLQNLAGAEPAEKAELLRALGERGDTEAAQVLLQNAASGSEPVRLAALDSLRKIAVPETVTPLLDLAAKSKSEAECEPVLKALYAVCQASRDKDQTTRSVLQAMAGVSTAERCRVLPVLAELGTPAALEAAQTATRDQDPELSKEAVRVLSQWPNAAPAPGLLELARTGTDPVRQVLALRGCIAVTGQEPDPAKRLATLQQALAAAQRPDEKKQALAQISQIATPQALQTAMEVFADKELVDEAGLAAVTIAEKLSGSNPKLASETADKVLAQCRTPDIVKRAWAIRGKRAAAGPFIQNWLISGPYRQTGVTGALALFDIEFGPEKKGDTVQWTAVPRNDTINLASVFPNQENCVAYLKTTLMVPNECEAALLVGSDDGVKAWLNGAVVLSHNIDRGLEVDQDMAPIQLHKGANELMLKITQGGGGWGACARVVGSDGKRLAGLKAQVEQ